MSKLNPCPPGKRKIFQWMVPWQPTAFPLKYWSISVSETLFILKNTKKYLGLDKWKLILLCPEEGKALCNCAVFFLIYGQGKQSIFIVTFIKMLAEKRWEWKSVFRYRDENRYQDNQKYMHLIHI